MHSYRVSKKYVAKMTVLFFLLTTGSIWAGFVLKSVEISPSTLLVFAILAGIYLGRLARDDSEGKGLQIILTRGRWPVF